jgi:hypothetical protein
MPEFAHCAKHHNQYRITEGCSECKKTEAGEEKNDEEQSGTGTTEDEDEEKPTSIRHKTTHARRRA